MKRDNNYLDYVYKINESLSWSHNEAGQVVVEMENKGFTNRIAQKFFNRPAVSHITLEGMGSFIFDSIDGKRSIYDIGLLVKEKYGEEAEPLFERLSVYMKRLDELKYIVKA